MMQKTGGCANKEAADVAIILPVPVIAITSLFRY